MIFCKIMLRDKKIIENVFDLKVTNSGGLIM